MKTKISGTGKSVPQKVVTNDDLAQVIDTSDEWIYTRTGIRSRHVAELKAGTQNTCDTASTLAAEAAHRALNNAEISAEDIELIIVATSSPDYMFPSTAAIVQNKIGAGKAMCFDISSACTGFIYALSIAEAYIQSGQFKNTLVIGSEIMSGEVDWKDRSTCVLFGDGAGAVVLTAENEIFDSTKLSVVPGIISSKVSSVIPSKIPDTDSCTATVSKGINCDTYFRTVSALHVDGSKGQVLTRGKDFIRMDGQEVFKFAVKKVPESINEVLEKANVPIEEIKYFVLHQANIRIIEAVAKRIGVEMSRFPTNLREYGNTSAASIPILLDEMNRSNILQRGDKIILSGFGAGLSWGSTLLEW